MINGFRYFSIEKHPLEERLHHAAQWLRAVNQSDLEPHTPWISLVWLGYRTLEGKFPFEEFKVLNESADLPELPMNERCRWEGSLENVREYLRVLRGLHHQPKGDHRTWVEHWPSAVIAALRIRCLWACERFTNGTLQRSLLTESTDLWAAATSRMTHGSDGMPYHIMDHHRATEALEIIIQATWKAGLMGAFHAHAMAQTRWGKIWSVQDWHTKSWRKTLEHSNWKP